jgi:hypothetical protein
MYVPSLEVLTQNNMTTDKQRNMKQEQQQGSMCQGNWSSWSHRQQMVGTRRSTTKTRSNNNRNWNIKKKWSFPSWNRRSQQVKQMNPATTIEDLIMNIHTPNDFYDDYGLGTDTSSNSLTQEDLLLVDDKMNTTKDDSFDTLTTETTVSSSSDDDDDLISFSDCGESCTTTTTRSVRFADEEGLPMERIFHYLNPRPSYEDDDDDDDTAGTSECIVLCLSPKARKFEFLHVGYYCENGQNDRSPTTLSDLMNSLPSMCTNETLMESSLDRLYRINKDTESLESLYDETMHHRTDLLLEGCNLNFCEMIVAAPSDSTEEEILEGMCPLLANKPLMKTLRRARRSRRGLKFVVQQQTQCSRGMEVLMETRDVLLKSVFVGLGLYYEEDDDIEDDERFELELMRAVFTVTGLTVLFSVLGIQ